MGQQSFADQVQRNEQSSQAAVTIQKRVDRFELIMRDPGSDQVWCLYLLMFREENCGIETAVTSARPKMC